LVQHLVEPPKPLDLNDMPENIKNWYNSGDMIKVGKFHMFAKQLSYTGSHENPATIVLIHGFPSSSFDYHKVDLDMLRSYGPVILYDHIGFGFSDKPATDFTYSIFELADYSLMLFEKLGLTDIIAIGHDMGDTVLAELVKRRSRNILPQGINLQGVAFTNGGINFKYAKLRLAQHILRNPLIGEGMNKLLVTLQPFFPYLKRKSFIEIWGRNHNSNERDQDIEDIQSLNSYKGGLGLLHKSIFYLNDRDHFEYSWHEAFRILDIPSMVIWGDDDAVAPAIIGSSIHEIIKDSKYEHKDGVGHFLMLEDPAFWSESVEKFLKSVQ